MLRQSSARTDPNRLHAASVGLVADAQGFVGAPVRLAPLGPFELSTDLWDARTGDVGGLVVGPYFIGATAGRITKTASIVVGKFPTLIGYADGPATTRSSTSPALPARASWR